jgi:hypothetical protein
VGVLGVGLADPVGVESGKAWNSPLAIAATRDSPTREGGSAMSASPAAAPMSVEIGPGWML